MELTVQEVSVTGSHKQQNVAGVINVTKANGAQKKNLS